MNEIEKLIMLDITDDEMEAWIELASPKGSYQPTVEDLKEYLKNKGIIYGIDEDKIKEIIENKLYNTKTLIAKGKPKVDGKDATIEYFFSKEKLAPKMLDNGRVDHHELGIVKNVLKGELLAKKTPATFGNSGFNIRGVELKARNGHDKILPRGENTELSSNGLELRATIDGFIHFKDRKINVGAIYKVPSVDVDQSTGNIDFVGTVQVVGNVKDGFKIKAGGDIEVKGQVEGCELIAGGNIIVGKGIYGRGKAKIIAAGSVKTKLIENATVEAEWNVEVQEHIINSNIKSGNKIKLTNEPGQIIGGKAVAVVEIDAINIGNESFTPTEIRVEDYRMAGIAKQVDELKEKIYQIKIKLGPAERALEELKKIKDRKDFLAEKRKQELFPIAQPYVELSKELAACQTQLNELTATIPKRDGIRIIRVKNNIYPRVKLSVEGQEMEIKDNPYNSKSFYIYNNELKIGGYKAFSTAESQK